MDSLIVTSLSYIFLSRTLLLPSQPNPPVYEHRLSVGFDAEWNAETKELLSVQFSVTGTEGPVFRVIHLEGHRLTPSEFLSYLRSFLVEVDIMPTPLKKARRVVLVAHFAEAELSIFEDSIRDLKIRQHNKAHHASFPDTTFPDDDFKWQVQIVDLFAFLPMSLAKIGKFVGLEKIDIDPTRLAQLRRDNPDQFNRYASRDAEIALQAFTQLRNQLLTDFSVDILTCPTLPSVAGKIFRYRFLQHPPAPFKSVSIQKTNRTQSGWKTGHRRQFVFNGNRDIRLTSCRAYHGGRVEAYVCGLVVTPCTEFDVRSLYPHAAILQALPNDKTKWRDVFDVSDINYLEGFGSFTFSFPPDCLYPCLPVKAVTTTRLTFPLKGESSCSFTEVREALKLGATIKVCNAYGFDPGETEINHDVAKYMRHFLESKNAAEKGSLEYVISKLFLNSLIGKFGEQTRGSNLIDFERKARQSGHIGLGATVAKDYQLRGSLQRQTGVGSLWAPEWACLILGRSRALMAEFVSHGAFLISTDSVIVPASTIFSGASIELLRSVGSDLELQTTSDAVFIARSRLYALLKRPQNIGPKDNVLAQDRNWGVVRVARHGTPETPEQFAETVLDCLRQKRDVAPNRVKKRLLGAEASIREGKHINDEVEKPGQTYFSWDQKRRLVKREAHLNIFTSYTDTLPYSSQPHMEASEYKNNVRNKLRTKRRKTHSRQKLNAAIELIRAGKGIREITRLTGVPKSTVSDIRKRLSKTKKQT